MPIVHLDAASEQRSIYSWSIICVGPGDDFVPREARKPSIQTLLLQKRGQEIKNGPKNWTVFPAFTVSYARR